MKEQEERVKKEEEEEGRKVDDSFERKEENLRREAVRMEEGDGGKVEVDWREGEVLLY